MEFSEDICAFALSSIFPFEPRISKAIVSNLGSAKAFFELSGEERDSIIGPYSRFREALDSVRLDRCAETLDRTCRGDTLYISHAHPAFPQILAQCEDAPIGFFMRCSDSPQNILGRHNTAIIGTRNATTYGVEWCRRLVDALAGSDQKPTIVSGLAYGIDITAHHRALEKGLPTIAVLGTGIDKIYPTRHLSTAERIIHTPLCAVISEFPPQSDVANINFLQRNRIIAGLSEATVLVESRIQGGGMTTARIAASYSREVYAIPGRNDDPFSQGCNVLIHSHIAEPIIGCDEFFRSRGYKVGRHRKGNGPGFRDFYQGSMDERRMEQTARILSLVRSNRDISIASLAEQTGMPLHEATSLLYRLESDGFVRIDILQRCSINS